LFCFFVGLYTVGLLGEALGLRGKVLASRFGLLGKELASRRDARLFLREVFGSWRCLGFEERHSLLGEVLAGSGACC
jgi:hypothetical protein